MAPKRSDLDEVLKAACEERGRTDWDLDEQLTTIERYFGLFEALNWAVSLDDRLSKDWPFDPIESPFHLRLDLLGLAWSSKRLSDRDDDSATAYDANLGDRIVGDTLLEISDLLTAGTKVVEGGVPERGSGPARLKEFADDLYEPEP